MPEKNTGADYFRETLDELQAQKFHQFVSQTPQPQIILGTQSESRRAVVNQLAERYAIFAPGSVVAVQVFGVPVCRCI